MDEKRISRREMLRGLGLTATGGLLAACAPKVVKETVIVEASPKVVEVEKVVTAVPEPSERITVDFMNWWGAHRQPLMEAAIAAFEEEHPNIHVVNALQPWDNRSERAATAIASRNPPAVIMTRREETYKFAQEGLIIPITDYIEVRGLDLDEIFYASDAANQVWDGKVWSFQLPGDGGTTSLYLYNKDVFRQAGLDPETPPETWQELEEACRGVTVFEGEAIKVIGANVVQTWAGATAYDFVSWLYCNDGEYVTDDARTLTFNSAQGIESLEWMVNFVTDIYSGYENQLDFFERMEGIDNPFFDELQAVYFAGTWAFGWMQSSDPDMYNDPDKWGVALRPYNSNRPNATHHGVAGLEQGWGYVISKDLPKELQDAAYEWIEWWILRDSPKEEGGCKFLFEQAQVSAVKKCNEDPAWYDVNPYWSVVLEGVETDVSVPITPVQSQVTGFLAEAVEQALYGQKEPKEALDWAAGKGQEVLDEFWSKV
ncbi:MAG: hypothetical protein AMJ93_06260 [Anaerolineae bacterium SM23_84]|nr:MAG: hypothetical protein AMJ93_06260 [Anaerolineae bacterium SM23_84]